MKKMFVSACLASLVLCACGSGSEGVPPLLAITSPASGSPVSGTAAVQVSADVDNDVSSVELYVREKGGEGRGVRVGVANQDPFVVQWYTPGQPNLAELDLIAVGKSKDGAEGESLPVTVRTQNSGVPSLQLLTAFTLAPDPTVGAANVRSALPAVDAAAVLAPADVDLSEITPPTAQLNTLADNREYILEWQWEPFAGQADGYGVYMSIGDKAGPFEAMIKQSATAGTGAQKFSGKVPAQAGDSFDGVVSVISNGATSESGFSNVDSATFLGPQTAVSPSNGEQVSAKPSLTWKATPGAAGYLYYVYDRNPFETGATLLYSNFPQSSSSLNGAYPSDNAGLPSGTYYWWVAGVSFDQNGKADGFSFSEPQSFVVP